MRQYVLLKERSHAGVGGSEGHPQGKFSESGDNRFARVNACRWGDEGRVRPWTRSPWHHNKPHKGEDIKVVTYFVGRFCLIYECRLMENDFTLSFLAISYLITVRFEKFKNATWRWQGAHLVIYIVKYINYLALYEPVADHMDGSNSMVLIMYW